VCVCVCVVVGGGGHWSRSEVVEFLLLIEWEKGVIY
jgi:hypothetical protein